MVVETAPAFAIVGEPVSLVLRVEDHGADPELDTVAPLTISLDGGAPLRFDVPIGRPRDPAGDAAARRDERAADRDAGGRRAS